MAGTSPAMTSRKREKDVKAGILQDAG